MTGRRKPVHVRADLGDHRLGNERPHPGMEHNRAIVAV